MNPASICTICAFHLVRFHFKKEFLAGGIPSFGSFVGKGSDGAPSDNKAFIAKRGETIDATIESHIYQVRLKDSLLSSLVFGKTRDGCEVAWIDARLTYQVRFLF